MSAPTEERLMTHDGLHWLTTVGMAVFVVAGCVVLGLSTMTFVAIWVGRGGPAPAASPRAPRPPLDPGAGR
jgi:hypothetical protein